MYENTLILLGSSFLSIFVTTGDFHICWNLCWNLSYLPCLYYIIRNVLIILLDINMWNKTPSGRDTVLKRADQLIVLFMCPLTSVKYSVLPSEALHKIFPVPLCSNKVCNCSVYFNMHVEDKQTEVILLLCSKYVRFHYYCLCIWLPCPERWRLITANNHIHWKRLNYLSLCTVP